MPDTIFSIIHLIFTATLEGRHYGYPHFRGGETEAKRAESLAQGHTASERQSCTQTPLPAHPDQPHRHTHVSPVSPTPWKMVCFALAKKQRQLTFHICEYCPKPVQRK